MNPVVLFSENVSAIREPAGTCNSKGSILIITDIREKFEFV